MDSVFSTHVVKCEGRYCRFGSYRTCSLVDSPLAATHYQRERDATKRASESHDVPTYNSPSSRLIPAREFKVYKITLSLVEETAI